MFWRMWTACVAVVALVLSVFSGLAVLQYNSVLSQLIRQRLAVVVTSTAQPFESIVDMGLPLSMVRNADDLLARAEQTDPAISAVYAFNASGVVLNGAGKQRPERVSDAVLLAQSESSDGKWSLESEDALISGVSIHDAGNTVVGGVLARYPKDELVGSSKALTERVSVAALGLWLVFALLSWAALKWRLRAIERQLGDVETRFGSRGVRANEQTTTLEPVDAALPELSTTLHQASDQYHAALQHFAAQPLPENAPTPDDTGERRPPALVGTSETALSRSLARRLTPVFAALVLGATLALGYFTYSDILASFGPEFDRRADLIGSIASADIGRAVAAGVPFDSLVGGSDYFGDLLDDFPEISYFAVVGDDVLLEVGNQQPGHFAAQRHIPIVHDDQVLGTITVQANPGYLASRFRDLLLDLAVVMIVVVLFSYEMIIVLMARMVTGPFERLLYLAGLQAKGDFSKAVAASGRSILGVLTRTLGQRARHLTQLQTASDSSGAGPDGAAPMQVGARLIRFCSLADIRLPLFLFAMADELPLSFFSLYARAADNPIGWLSPSVVIGLPLAFYLLAALLGAPFARPLATRFGHRNLFLAAAMLTIVSNVGLFAGSGIVELIAYMAIKGVGYALASLACQDYVLDMLPKQARARSLNLFRTALFSGVFAGTALGGIIADRIGQHWVFMVCALLTVIAATMIWRLLPIAARSHEAGASDADESAISFNLLAPLRNLRFAAIALGIAVPLAIVDHVFISYLLSLQMDQMGASAADIGRVMMSFFLAVILAGMGYDKLPVQLARPGLILIGATLLTGAALVLAATVPSSWTILLATICAGLGFGLAGGPQTALAMDLVEGPLSHLGQNSVLGALRVIERGGSIVGLFVVGSLVATFGYSGSVGVIGIIVLTGLVIFALLHVASARQEQGAGHHE